MLARWSWPRFRFDQLMALAWKVMLPLGLVNLVAVAVLAGVRRRARRSSGLRPQLAMVGLRLGRADRRLVGGHADRRRRRATTARADGREFDTGTSFEAEEHRAHETRRSETSAGSKSRSWAWRARCTCCCSSRG